MIMVLKKRNLIAMLLAVLTTVTLSGAAYHYFSGAHTFLPNEGKVVVMDAGHGATWQYYEKVDKNRGEMI